MKDSTFMLPEEELATLAQQYRFENGDLRNVGKNIVRFKLGTEYASGGAGGISTVDDYMKFLEGLRTCTLLRQDTVTLLQTDRLTEHQKRTYGSRGSHGYGLGVRCPINSLYTDFGWDGAAGAYLAVDTENELSMYCALHLLAAPIHGIRSMLSRLVKAELFQTNDIENIQKDLSRLYKYDRTF
jgi:CubicO group peptidase (beta-lactamase class C family)